MNKKYCPNCKQEKTLSEFYFDPYHKKYRYNCKDCHKKTTRSLTAYNYRHSKRGKEAVRAATRRALVKFPEKWEARAKLRYAVKIGHIIKPDICEVNEDCSGRIEAHHYKGYEGDHWKDIHWLCSKHHAKEHTMTSLKS